MKASPLQWGIFAAAAALAVALLFSFRHVPHASRQPAPRTAALAPPQGAGHPTTVLSGFDYAQTSAGKPKFQVHADRTVGFAQGAGLPSTWYGLEAVALTLFSDQAEPFKVRSDTADYDPRTKAMHLKGSVLMTDTSGTKLRTTKVDYDPSRNLLLVPEPIEMLRAGIHGRASSAVYDARSRELSLAGPVTAEGVPGAEGAPFSSLRSDRGIYRRLQGEIELNGHVEGIRGTDRFSSESLRLHLTEVNQIDRATAEGSVSGSVAQTPGQAPQIFSGTHATLVFGAEGTLDRILLSGAPARIESSQVPPEAGSRRIQARDITLEYASEVLRRARAEGSARMERNGRNAKGAPLHETIQSDSVAASFAADGTIDSARFAGDVVVTSPDAIAHAPAALFEGPANRMTFLADGNRDAEVSAVRGKVVARRIQLSSDSSQLTATDSARAFLKPSSENRGLPEFLSSSKKPTRAKADRIELDDSAKTATFAGNAAIWQEANALFGDRIKLFDKDRSASADGAVRAVARAVPSSGADKEQTLTTVTAEKMQYHEVNRTARFEGRVLATRDTQVAEGESAESRFNTKNQIERTVLSGNVKFFDPVTGRRGSGDRVEDEPLAGITTLFGDPAVAQDAQGNRVAGAILTFRKDSGSVEAKAKDGQKIESIYKTKGQSHGQGRGRMN